MPQTGDCITASIKNILYKNSVLNVKYFNILSVYINNLHSQKFKTKWYNVNWASVVDFYEATILIFQVQYNT